MPMTIPQSTPVRRADGNSVPSTSVAVIISHGMGQQIPFETLDAMASGMVRVAAQQGVACSEPTAETVVLSKQRLHRVRLQAVDANGQQAEIHLYEGYWAPITEGKVGIGDVLSFLFSAGGNGLRNSLRKFSRWIFGALVCWPVHWLTTFHLLTALCVTLSLILMHTLIGAAVVTHLVTTNTAGWPSETLVVQSSRTILMYTAFSFTFGLALRFVARMKQTLKRPAHKIVWRALNILLDIFFRAWVGVTIGVAGLLIYLVIRDYFAPPQEASSGPVLWLLAVWGILLAVSWIVRSRLVQYLGDVAAYIASHRLDRFMEIRTTIKRWVGDVVRAVYDAKADDGTCLYDRVGLVGHSLGSVIMYDVLNSLLNEDKQRSDDKQPGDGAADTLPRNVVERTKILLTFGAPLDKTAFLFRVQGQETGLIREQLAASVQPLIQSYPDFRRFRWVNVYAHRDIFAGPLEYYDDCRAEGYDDRWKVQNVVDEEALIPLMAHTEYWGNQEIFKQLYAGLFSDDAVKASVAPASAQSVQHTPAAGLH